MRAEGSVQEQDPVHSLSPWPGKSQEFLTWSCPKGSSHQPTSLYRDFLTPLQHSTHSSASQPAPADFAAHKIWKAFEVRGWNWFCTCHGWFYTSVPGQQHHSSVALPGFVQEKQPGGSSLQHQGPRSGQLSHGVIFYNERSTELKDYLHTTLITAYGAAESTSSKCKQSFQRGAHSPCYPLTEVMCNFPIQQDVLIHWGLTAQKHCRVLDLELLTQPAYIYFSLAWVTWSPDRFLNLKIQEGHWVNKKPEEQRPFVPSKPGEGHPGRFVAQLDFYTYPCHTGYNTEVFFL